MCVCFQRRLRPPPPPLFFWTPQNETSNPFKKQKRPFVFPNRADFFRTRRLRTSSKTHLCPHKKKAETEIFREEEHDNNDNNDNNTGCTVVSSKKTNSGTRERERRSRFFFRRATGRHDRRPRRVQVAEIRSEEHQIGVVPEKLLPMHASRLSREETGRKRRRQVRKRTQSREAELAAAQPKDGFAPRKIWEGREEEE